MQQPLPTMQPLAKNSNSSICVHLSNTLFQAAVSLVLTCCKTPINESKLSSVGHKNVFKASFSDLILRATVIAVTLVELCLRTTAIFKNYLSGILIILVILSPK